MGQRKKEKKKGKKNKKSRILIFTFAKDLPCTNVCCFFFFFFFFFVFLRGGEGETHKRQNGKMHDPSKST